MKNPLLILFLLAAVITLPSCAAITGIFKAGVWVGILLVGFVVFLIIFLLGRKK